MDGHLVLAVRRREGDVLGVEHQPSAGVAVEWVADNGAPQTLRMGTVYAQLVRAARLRE